MPNGSHLIGEPRRCPVFFEPSRRKSETFQPIQTLDERVERIDDVRVRMCGDGRRRPKTTRRNGTTRRLTTSCERAARWTTDGQGQAGQFATFDVVPRRRVALLCATCFGGRARRGPRHPFTHTNGGKPSTNIHPRFHELRRTNPACCTVRAASNVLNVLDVARVPTGGPTDRSKLQRSRRRKPVVRRSCGQCERTSCIELSSTIQASKRNGRQGIRESIRASLNAGEVVPGRRVWSSTRRSPVLPTLPAYDRHFLCVRRRVRFDCCSCEDGTCDSERAALQVHPTTAFVGAVSSPCHFAGVKSVWIALVSPPPVLLLHPTARVRPSRIRSFLRRSFSTRDLRGTTRKCRDRLSLSPFVVRSHRLVWERCHGSRTLTNRWQPCSSRHVDDQREVGKHERQE